MGFEKSNDDPYLRGLHYALEYNSVGEPAIRTQAPGGFNTDLFGRTKISEPFTLFDSFHRYKLSGDFSTLSAGSGGVTYDANASAKSMNVTSASGDKVYCETYKVFPYQPGKSLQVMHSFVFSPALTGLRQRVGYFGLQNGVFLELSDSTVYIVKRSYVTGSVEEERITQANWNNDPMDGTGPSKVILDLEKAQIFWQEYEWLGVGSVQTGFVINGKFIVCHTFQHANIISSTYMTTATLPIRYEIENTAGTSGSSTLKQICCTVISNGGYNRDTVEYTATRTSSVTTSSSILPVIALRLNSSRLDSVVFPKTISIGATSVNGVIQWSLIKNPTTALDGSWNNFTTTGTVDTNVSAANAVVGGTVVRSGIISTSSQTAVSQDIGGLNRFDLQLGRDQSGNSDVLVVAVQALNGTPSVYSALAWQELT